LFQTATGGTAAAAPPPFRPSDPALCGSRPLVTPYYCRLGDLLCFVFIVRLLCVWFLCVLCVPSVYWYCWLGLLTCKNRLPYNLYCVGGDIKHCSIQSNPDCNYSLGEKNVSGLAWSSLQTVCTRVHGLHYLLWMEKNIHQNSYQQDQKASYKQIPYHFATDEAPNYLYREHTVFEHR